MWNTMIFQKLLYQKCNLKSSENFYIPNLDFRRAAKFIHTNCHPTWISLGVPNKDTMRVFYLLANKTNIGKYK